MDLQGVLSAVGPMPGKSEGTLLAGLWGRGRSYLIHIALVVLVALFMCLYIDGRQFFLSHTLTLRQADGTVTHESVRTPVQRDITTIISLLASTTRGAATFWLAGIDLRCIFLFMQRGGITLEGMQSTFRRSLPGRRDFLWKTNFIILVALNAGILLSTYTSSILAGSVTWKPAILYRPGQQVTGIPLGQLGDLVIATNRTSLLDSLVGWSTAINSIFYGDAKNRYSVNMHRLIPDEIRALPINSTFVELTVPYFAVDAFEWIKDPISTISPSQLNITTFSNITGPRVMLNSKFGLIPDEHWGPSEQYFSEPLTISETRTLVMSGLPNPNSTCHFDQLAWTIPSDVQPLNATLNGYTACLVFAKVTYRAGAARSRRCRMSGTGVVEDVGNVKDLELVGDPVTSVALALAPYVSTTLYDVGYAIPFGTNQFSSMQNVSIELLSRSYQVAWSALVSTYGSNEVGSDVSIAVDASIASVLIWRVVLWAALHGLLVTFGFVFRHLHTRGNYPWIEDPITTALFVDPTPLKLNDPTTRTWAGKEPPHIGGTLELKDDGTNKYLVLKENSPKEKKSEGDPEKDAAALLDDRPTLLLNDPMTQTWAGKEPPHIDGTLELEENASSQRAQSNGEKVEGGPEQK